MAKLAPKKVEPKKATSKALVPQTDQAQQLAAEHTKNATALARAASSLTIANKDQYQKGADFISTLKKARDEVEALRKSITKPIDDAKAKVMALFKPVVAQYSEAISVADRKMIAFVEEEEALARKEVEKQAKKLERKGLSDVAEDVRQAAVVQAAPKALGTSIREQWSASVVDFHTLVKAVADGLAPIECLEANTTYLNGLARVTKSEECKIPGVIFVRIRTTGRTAGGY